MKLVELITTPECQHIYQRYFKIVATPKPPHQITSKQIYQEIVAYYNGSIQNVLDILCYDEIVFLQNFEKTKSYRKDIPTINTLINKCLLIKNPNNNNYLEIPEDIKINVINAVEQADIDKVIQIDQINELLIGILAIRGIIEPQELVNIYHSYDPSLSRNEVNTHLDTNHYLFQHYFIYQGETELLLAYEPYRPIIQKIEQLQTLVKKTPAAYTAKQLRTIAKYGFDLSEPAITNLYEAVEQIDKLFVRELFRDSIMLFCQIHGDLNDLIYMINELKITNNQVIEHLEKNLRAAVPLIHSAAFYGLSPYDYYLTINKDSYFSEQESSTFYQLYLSLLEYTNQVFKITDISMKNLDYIEQDDFSQIRTLLFDNPNIIDHYISENPEHLTNYELTIINDFKAGFIDDFLILTNLDDYTLVSNETGVYAIYGLVNHLKEIYPNSTLPQVCNLALLPYRHKIVFDGLLEDRQSILPHKQIRTYSHDDIIYELPHTLLN